jgi:hypothetical protein
MAYSKYPCNHIIALWTLFSFGELLKDWANHMYANWLMYTSLQDSDTTFFTQVLFCIDRALQINWRSCCECQDQDSVNDRNLLMQDKRDLIIQHNFSYHLPKLLKDKLLTILTPIQDDLLKDKNRFQGKGGQDKDPKNHIKSLKDIITDPDLSHMRWHLQEGENFSTLFCFKQKRCPKTSEGKLIYMNLFIRGITCHRSSSSSQNHRVPSNQAPLSHQDIQGMSITLSNVQDSFSSTPREIPNQDQGSPYSSLVFPLISQPHSGKYSPNFMKTDSHSVHVKSNRERNH